MPENYKLDSLTVAERAELVERLRARRASLASQPVIQAREPGKPIPASVAQQQIWLMQQLDPTDATYNIVDAVGLHGSARSGCCHHGTKFQGMRLQSRISGLVLCLVDGEDDLHPRTSRVGAALSPQPYG